MRRFIVLCAFILFIFCSLQSGLFAQRIGISWEFNEDGDTEGWGAFQALSDLTVSNGSLKTTVTGYFPQFIGPQIEISAADYGSIVIRMRTTGVQAAEIQWKNDAAVYPYGKYKFDIISDSAFHEYYLPVYTQVSWIGHIISMNRITFLAPVGAQIEIDYIRIVHLGSRVEVSEFKPQRVILKPGMIIPVMAVIKNAGDDSGSVNAQLILPENFDLLQGDTVTDIGELARGAKDTLRWLVTCPVFGNYRIQLRVMLNDSMETNAYFDAPVVDQFWRQQEFFLSAWSPPYAWYPPPYDDAVFDYYHNANFDNVLWITPTDEAIAMVEKFNMKCLLIVTSLVGGDAYLRASDNLQPPEITSEMLANLDPVIEKYRNNPTVIGYFIVDEPKTKAFPNLGKVVAYLRKKDPTRLGFINLFPGSGSSSGLGAPTYDRYIELFLDLVKPELLSYDRYIFYKDHDGVEFFNNISTIRKWALRYDIPFCNIIQAIGTDQEPDLNWRTPNEAEHRWLVYNSLAYGAKALIWFHWHLNWGVTGSPDREKIYASLQKVNGEINRIGPVMIKLNSQAVYHANHVSRGGIPLPDDALVKSVSENANLVVGLFKDDDDKDYFMLVNKDYKNTVTAMITLKYAVENLTYFDIDSSRWEEVRTDNTENGAVFQVSLRPGSGKLFSVGAITGVKESPENSLPETFRLQQNYPNPFNSGTSIGYEIGRETAVKMTIYDLSGHEIAMPVNDRQKPGKYSIRFDGTDLASGVYLVKIQAGEFCRSRKMLLLK